MKLLLVFVFALPAAQAFSLPWGFGGGTVGTPSPAQLRRFTPPPLFDLVAKLNHRSPPSGHHEHVRRIPPPLGDDNRRTEEPVLLSRAPDDLSLQNHRTPAPVDLHGRTPGLRFSRPPPEEDNRGHTAEPIVIRSRAPSDLNRRTPPPLANHRTPSPGEDILLSRAPEDLNKGRRTPPPLLDAFRGFSHPPAVDRFTHGVLLSRAPNDDVIRRRTTASGDAEPPFEARRHSLPYVLPTGNLQDLWRGRRSTPGDLAPPAEDCDHGSTAPAPVA